jgi:hypothetical protein
VCGYFVDIAVYLVYACSMTTTDLLEAETHLAEALECLTRIAAGSEDDSDSISSALRLSEAAIRELRGLVKENS